MGVVQHKGQTPKVKTCAGQSLSEACITIFHHKWSVRRIRISFLRVFPSFRLSRLPRLFNRINNNKKKIPKVKLTLIFLSLHQLEINVLYIIVFTSLRGARSARKHLSACSVHSHLSACSHTDALSWACTPSEMLIWMLFVSLKMH